jgi:thymidylate synthase
MDRTGTGTLSVFGRQIRHKMSEGFPLLTTKKMYWKGIVTELLWFLRGDTNIKYLVDNNCHIWDGDAYKNYKSTTEYPLSIMEFIDTIKNDSLRAKTWGELGPIYGKQWRSFGPSDEYYNGTEWVYISPIDQISKAIEMIKEDPDSRRIMVTAWNPSDLPKSVLPPCHYGFQFYTRELSLEERRKLANYDSEFISPIQVESWDRNNIPTRAISLMWNQRSVDVPLGLPFNIASYALLLSIIAEVTNMVPDEVISNMGDCHIYLNQVDAIKEQIIRNPRELPELKINREPFDNYISASNSGKTSIDHLINDLNPEHFSISGYDPHPTIKIPLSN